MSKYSELADETPRALQWAREQNFQSVAARYAKLIVQAHDKLEAENARLREDAERWRFFVRHKTFWRSSGCIQYGGEVSSLRPGGPGEHELKKQSFDAAIDAGRAALQEGE